MATVLQTISQAKIKVRFKEVYASEGINKKSAVVVPAGPYRGLGLGTAVSDMSVTIEADPVALDHVAVYETADGYSLTIRDIAGDIIVDLTALASNTVVIALYVDYVLGTDTVGDYRAYLYADYLTAPEKDELVVLGTVVVPASGAIAASAITPALRTMTWENKVMGGLSWQPLLRNSSFEMGETGAIYLHSSPYWQTIMSGFGTFGIGPIDTDANSGDKCLEMLVAAGVMTAEVKQYLQVPVVTGQLIKLKLAKKVLIAATVATGTATVTLDFADKDGASLSSVSTTFDIESVDASWQEIEGVLVVPTGVRVLQSVTVDIVGTYPGSGLALHLDDIQVWLEPSANTDWLPGDTRPTSEVATQALLLGDENSYDGNSVLVKYSGNVLRFLRRDASIVVADQYETNFPGSVTAQGLLTLGQDYIGTGANAEQARVLAPAGVTGSSVDFTLMWESIPSGEKGYRKYVSSSGELIETVNASFDSGGPDWSKDVNGEESLRITCSKYGVTTEWQAPTVNSWADSAWTRTVVETRGSSSLVETVGQSISSSQLFRDEADNRRWCIDHNGMPVGRIQQWREVWPYPVDYVRDGAGTDSIVYFGWLLDLVSSSISHGEPGDGGLQSSQVELNPGSSDTNYGDLRSETKIISAHDDSMFAVETVVRLHNPVAANNTHYSFGLNQTSGGTNRPPADTGLYLYKDTGDTNWKAAASSGGPTIVDTGIPPLAWDEWQRLRIEYHGANSPGGARALFFIDDVLGAKITTDLPGGASAYPMWTRFRVESRTAAGANLGIGPVYWVWQTYGPDVGIL